MIFPWSLSSDLVAFYGNRLAAMIAFSFVFLSLFFSTKKKNYTKKKDSSSDTRELLTYMGVKEAVGTRKVSSHQEIIRHIDSHRLAYREEMETVLI